MIKIHKAFYLLVLILVCCRKPYTPTIVSSQSNYLVVEGLINSGNDSTLIKLSRTVKINDTTKTINPVLGAQVTVESDQNGSWLSLIHILCEIHNGYGQLLTLPITDIPLVPSVIPPTGFFYSSACCVDCTLRGSNKRPPFWK